MDEARELELKLAGQEADLRKAEAAVRRVAGRGAKWDDDRLKSVYYDTADGRLATRGVVLRVRQSAKGRVQTVKAKGSDGIAMDRAEWEMPVRTASPDLDVLPPPARDRMGLVLAGELKRLFSVDVRRRKMVIDFAADGARARIEVAVDRGEVSARRKKQPISEVELELVDGDPAALYVMAREIASGTGLYVSKRTKSGAGQELLAPRPVAGVKAPKFQPTAKASVGRSLTTIFRTCLANVLANEEAIFDGGDPEGVHQMRVSLRRMRSALSVFRKHVDGPRLAEIGDELKWMAGTLGPARDWDVFDGELLAGVAGFGLDEAGTALLRRLAAERREAGYAAARESVRSPRYTALVLDLSILIERAEWGGDAATTKLGDVAPHILSRARKKLLKDGAGIEEMTMRERHAVRIRLKKFRYAVEFLQGLFPTSAVHAMARQLARLQDDFGHLNDVVVAEGLLDELVTSKGLSAADRRAVSFAAGQVLGWYARGVYDDDVHFLSDWRAFADARPFWKRRRGGPK